MAHGDAAGSAERQDFLGKVASGRSTRQVDPNQPALSEGAEVIRQAQAIDQANAIQASDEAIDALGPHVLRRPLGPLGTEIVGRTQEGRPIIKNPDGSFSTERTVTLGVDGGFVNVPTIFGGKEVSPEQALDIVARNKFVDPETGRSLTIHKSESEALKAAQARSDSIDVGVDPIDQLGPHVLRKPEVVAPGTSLLDDLKPRLTTEDLMGPSGQMATAFGLAGFAAAGPPGAVFGVLSSLLIDEGTKRLVEQYGPVKGILASIGLSAITPGGIKKTVDIIKGTTKLPVKPPRIISKTELDLEVSSGAHDPVRIGEPDTPFQRVRETGRTVVDRDLSVGLEAELPRRQQAQTGELELVPQPAESTIPDQRELFPELVPPSRLSPQPERFAGTEQGELGVSQRLTTSTSPEQPTLTTGERIGDQRSLTAPDVERPRRRVVDAGDQLSLDEQAVRQQRQFRVGQPQRLDPQPIEPLLRAARLRDTSRFGNKHFPPRLDFDSMLREAHDPLRDYRLTLSPTSPRGSQSVLAAEEDLGMRYAHIPDIPKDAPLYFPGVIARSTQATLDVFRSMGGVGREIAERVDNVFSNRDILSSVDHLNTIEQLEALLGTRSLGSRVIQGFRMLTKGENAFIFGLKKTFKVSESDMEKVFNYMYTNGRMDPGSERLRRMGQIIWKDLGVGPSQAAGDAQLTVLNPITGKRSLVGTPHMYVPQMPVHAATTKGIADTELQIMYNRMGGLEGTDLSFTQWKSQLNHVLSRGGEFREVSAAQSVGSMEAQSQRYNLMARRQRGLENARLLDLESLGGSPYQWAKKLGYETDVYRAHFRQNSATYLRVEWEKALRPLSEAMVKLEESASKSLSAKDARDLLQWSQLALDRMMGVRTGAVETDIVKGLSRGFKRFNDITLLQFAAPGSIPQFGYPFARGGLGNSLLGAIDWMRGVNKAAVGQQGSRYLSYMNQMIQPDGAWAISSSAAHKLYGVTATDRGSRSFAGHVAIRYNEFLERSMRTDPTHPGTRQLIKEIGGDPDIIAQLGHIPEAMKAKMAQRFTLYSAGGADARTVQLWATNESAWFKLANQYRTFALNNQAEVVRLWKEAPTLHQAVARITRLVVGAGAPAALSGALTEAIRNSLSGETDGNMFVNKTLAKALGGNEAAAFAIQTIFHGIGTMFGMVALTALDSTWKAVGMVTAGPTGAFIAGLGEDVRDMLVYGPSWKTVRTLSRRVPGVGPTFRGFVQDQIRGEREAKQREDRLMRSLTITPENPDDGL